MSAGYLWLTTGIPVGKHVSMETCGSESPVITGLHGSGCMFWVMQVLVRLWLFIYYFATFWVPVIIFENSNKSS